MYRKCVGENVCLFPIHSCLCNSCSFFGCFLYMSHFCDFDRSCLCTLEIIYSDCPSSETETLSKLMWYKMVHPLCFWSSVFVVLSSVIDNLCHEIFWGGGVEEMYMKKPDHLQYAKCNRLHVDLKHSYIVE